MSSRPLRSCCLLLCALSLFCTPRSSSAHGVAGKRFFPSTLAVDDPFVSDEMSILFNHLREPEQETNELSFAFAKRITPSFGVEIADSYRFIKPNGEKNQSGFGNLELGAKYQFFTSDSHETILSFGLEAEIGGTGDRAVDADSFSTLSPRLFFGKGFGDLPETVKYLKPFAVTGAIGPSFPTRAKNVNISVDPVTGEIEREVEANPNIMEWGFTLQYSLPYLQSMVKDVGLPAPLDRTILVVEFPFETCLDRGCGGETTGFVNPGIIWVGKVVQFGIEAQIPVNHETGNHVGVLALVHFFIDDLFPKSLGRPIFK
jgi:hypothetical protein